MTTIMPPDGLKPLPERPNIEFERKRAKKLVREKGGAIKLAEAQFMIARDYGFASWRKLVAYYTTWALHDRTGPDRQAGVSSERLDASVQTLLREFNQRKALPVQQPDVSAMGAGLSTFVPRFYGLTDAEIFSSTLTEAEAQLVVARRRLFSTYAELKAHAAALPIPGKSGLSDTNHPFHRAINAMRNNDRDTLARLFAENPRWFAASSPSSGSQLSVVRFAAGGIRNGTPGAREIFDWVVSLLAEQQPQLDLALLGERTLGQSTAVVQALLDHGANPHWLPHNGYSVLEHAVVRYKNGAATDLIAGRVTPRKAFWIAAALGDLPTLFQFINLRGQLNDAARNDRPDFHALRSTALGGTGRPDAPDSDIIWEAFMLAAMNGRTNTMEALLDRGLPVDYSTVQYTALHWALVEGEPAVAELLLARGANPDLRAWIDQSTPREMLASKLESMPADISPQRITAEHMQALLESADRERAKLQRVPARVTSIGTHDASLEDAARLTFQLLRFETGVSTFRFLPVGREVTPDIVIAYLASTPSPLLLAPTLRAGVVALMMVNEFDEERKKWAQHSIDNSQNALAEFARQYELNPTSQILLEFNGESHVFSFETVRQSFRMFTVMVGWSMQALRGHPNAVVQLLVHGGGVGGNLRSGAGRAGPVPPV